MVFCTTSPNFCSSHGKGHFEVHVVLCYLSVSTATWPSARTRKSMRPDHSSFATFNTGKLSVAFPSAGLIRRSASSLPSLCPIVMTSG
jgi:hypothetical protein